MSSPEAPEKKSDKPSNKDTEIWELYEEEDFIDAKDNQGDWRVGYILDKNTNTKWYKVRFDGWASKYDEVTSSSILVLQIQYHQTQGV